MNCLYRSDYGPPDPHFDPLAGHGMLILGFEAHRATLAQAQNLGQLEAMKRQLLHGREIQWCEQGYGWTYQRPVDGLFVFIVVAVILPWFIWRAPRLFQRLKGRAATVDGEIS